MKTKVVPYIKTKVLERVVEPLKIGDNVYCLEDVESRSLPFVGTVTAVAYPDRDMVTIHINSRDTIYVTSYIKEALDPLFLMKAHSTTGISKEEGTVKSLPDFGVVSLRVSGVVKAHELRRGSLKQFSIVSDSQKNVTKSVPLKAGDTFKSTAGSGHKEYQVDWIAEDGAMVVHRIDGYTAAEQEKMRRQGKEPYERPLESLLFRRADTSFWKTVDSVKYEEFNV